MKFQCYTFIINVKSYALLLLEATSQNIVREISSSLLVIEFALLFLNKTFSSRLIGPNCLFRGTAFLKM